MKTFFMGARNGDRNKHGGDRALLDRGYGWCRRGDRWLPDRWMGMPPVYVVTPPSGGLLNTLVSYWKLDEASGMRNDSKGTNHLTPVNGPTGSAGKINNGALFSGASNQYLTVASNASLQVTGDFSWSAWVRPDAQGSSLNVILKGNSGDTGVYEYWLNYDNLSGFTVFIQFKSVLTGVAVPNGTMTHVVFWWDSSDSKIRLRINDTTTYVSSTTAPLTQGTDGLFFGADPTYPSGFTGLIDEVGFWKRKLTAAEITQLYNGGAGLPFSSFT
jgi:hypothetical protein